VIDWGGKVAAWFGVAGVLAAAVAGYLETAGSGWRHAAADALFSVTALCFLAVVAAGGLAIGTAARRRRRMETADPAPRSMAREPDPADWNIPVTESAGHDQLGVELKHRADDPAAYKSYGETRCTVTDPGGSSVTATGRARVYSYPYAFPGAPNVRPGIYRFLWEGRTAKDRWVRIIRSDYEVKSWEAGRARARQGSAPADDPGQPPGTERPSRLIRTLTGHTGIVNGVAFSLDGFLLATAGEDGTARLWEVADGTQVGTTSVLRGPVTAVAFSPGGTLLATAGQNTQLWDAATGALVRTLTDRSYLGEWSVAFSPDGTLLATGDRSGSVSLWDVASGTLVKRMGNPTVGRVSAVAFSPDGTLLAAACSDKTARLWEVPSGTMVHVLSGHAKQLSGVAFSPDGILVATAAHDKTARLWMVAGGRQVRTLNATRSDYVEGVAFSPDGALLATAMDGDARLWQVRSGTPVRTLTSRTYQHVYKVAFSRYGGLLAAAGYDGTVNLWG